VEQEQRGWIIILKIAFFAASFSIAAVPAAIFSVKIIKLVVWFSMWRRRDPNGGQEGKRVVVSLITKNVGCFVNHTAQLGHEEQKGTTKKERTGCGKHTTEIEVGLETLIPGCKCNLSCGANSPVSSMYAVLGAWKSKKV